MPVYCLRSSCSIFFFKQKTAYEMRISDWSSDVCSSDLPGKSCRDKLAGHRPPGPPGTPPKKSTTGKAAGKDGKERVSPKRRENCFPLCDRSSTARRGS